MKATGYGYFPGGDPRDFRPDSEMCTAAEIAAHTAACEAWDRGETTLPKFGRHTVTTPDGEAAGIRAWVTFSPFGIGMYTYEYEEPDWDAMPCQYTPDCPCGACRDAAADYEASVLARFRGEVPS